MQQNQVAGQAVQAGAFGGGREGVQQAELERATQQISDKHKHKVSKCITISSTTTSFKHKLLQEDKHYWVLEHNSKLCNKEIFKV
jgi:hypothetical protein